LYASKASAEARRNKRIDVEDVEFPVLVIPGYTKIPGEKQNKRRTFSDDTKVLPPRYMQMSPDQDWVSSWPTAHTFKWSAVPLPIRQGYVSRLSENQGMPPQKYANPELMKIPNFLHLTPAHIKRHCQAIKEYCNPWPEGLETDEDCERHFPLTVTTSDYVLDGPSVRDTRARKVQINFKLSSLELDYHGRDKFIRLAGEHYNPESDMVTIQSDRCPLKKQNYDFLIYVMTALYRESLKTEVWESEKELEDMEAYFWDINPSRKAIVDVIMKQKEVAETLQKSDVNMEHLETIPEEGSEEDIVQTPDVQLYKEAVNELHNDGEDLHSTEKISLLLQNSCWEYRL